MDKLKSIYASACSAIATIIAVVAMTIGAELSPEFKNTLAGFTGWVTKSWVTIILFVLLFYVFRLIGKSASDSQTKKALFALGVIAILGFLAILGFYTYEFVAR